MEDHAGTLSSSTSAYTALPGEGNSPEMAAAAAPPSFAHPSLDQGRPLLAAWGDEDEDGGAGESTLPPPPRGRAGTEAAVGLDAAAALSEAEAEAEAEGFWSGFFQVGRDFEASHVTHKFTRKEKERMQSFESLDSRRPCNRVLKRHQERQPVASSTSQWLAFALVGVAVGLVAFVLKQTIEVVAKSRAREVDRLVEDGREGAAFVFGLAHTTALAAVSALLVVLVQPAAAGSGVPEVIAYLNGVRVSRVFNVRTALVKFASCVCAVASGLPVGPEGPMIHLGSAIGAGLSQGRSRTLGFSTSLFRRFRNTSSRREFITGGAASGVAAAFGAPVGGLLFAMEEVASYWAQQLTWQIFFATMCATFVVNLFSSAFEDWKYRGGFGYWQDSATILFKVETVVRFNVAAIPAVAVIGLLGGLLGTLFTFVNLKVTRARNVFVVPHRARRVLEVALVAAAFSAVMYALPYLFSCEEDVTAEVGVGEEESGPELKRWTCAHGHYNPAATLTFGSGDDAIKHLLLRGTPDRFGYGPVLAFFGVYFVFACYTAGSAVSSGLVVPMLLIGACVGRVVGLGMHDWFGAHHEWIDPGVFALVGSAAFFAGVSRLTVSLTVILVEISNDVHLALPIMLAVMISKRVADYATHSLYHALLEIKCVPFLNPDPVVPKLGCFTAAEVMSRRVVSVRSRVRVRDVVGMLRSCRHNGFPVVVPSHARRDEPAGGGGRPVLIFKGLVLRSQLEMLLRHARRVAVADPRAESPVLSFEDVSRYEDDLHARQRDNPLPPADRNLDAGLLESWLDLAPYVDTAAHTVNRTFSLDETYQLFRGRALRHLVVTSDLNEVCGMVTRKDLLGQNIEERLEAHQRVASRMP